MKQDFHGFIRHLVKLTGTNSHTEARHYVAMRYEFTSMQALQLKHVVAMQRKLEYLPSALGVFRDTLHRETMALIGEKMGNDIAFKIRDAL